MYIKLFSTHLFHQLLSKATRQQGVLLAHLGVLSAASRRLHRVRSLDDLLRCGGGLVRGVVRALLHHVLTLLALRCGRARTFTQDWWAGGGALVWVTGSAGGRERAREDKTINIFHLYILPHVKTTGWSLKNTKLNQSQMYKRTQIYTFSCRLKAFYYCSLKNINLTYVSQIKEILAF